ncbi:unnamed protein product, partial [Heterotrigona itama]
KLATLVLEVVGYDPHVSTRQISRQSGISQSSGLQILQAHKMYLYYPYICQKLHRFDFQNRVQFAEWFLQQVAWLRVDTQTILTIASHVITKNHRIAVSHSDHRTWFLHIREVKESDRGWYMCQINTDPMKSQTGYLQVV